ncbi:restriction endonuclease subunit S [Streptomyces sp. NPDC047070]|uniref:restriction endonuclease subunit S n=1 Tax=Streptomyces sp. NPDC047070 TaxID=3154923 RepID=UPI003453FE28
MSVNEWPRVRSRFAFHRRDVRGADAPLASATQSGVLLRDDLDISVWNPDSDVSSYKLVEPGDFVIGLRSFQHGISYSKVRGIVSPAYTVLRGTDRVHPEFFKHYFRSPLLISQLANLTQGIRQGQAIDVEAFANLELPIPPLDEQRRIADFLDTETARINALSETYKSTKSTIIERAQFMIDALIYGAGTPAPLKYFVKFREGPGIMAVDFQEGGTPLIRVSGLRNGEVTLKGANYLSEEKVSAQWSQFRLKLGDYLISGSATMGAISIVKDAGVVGAIPYTGLIVLRPADPNVVMEYIATALRSSLFIRQIDLLKTGATMQHFGPTHLAQVSLPIPERERQKDIASTARVIGDQSAVTTAAIDRQLSLLSERRQALITAAVTGQFDVTTAGRATPFGDIA